MSLRIRLGPVSVSSRGRVGASVGPVSGSLGPRRRSRGPSSPARGALVLVIFAALTVGKLLHHDSHGPGLTPAQRAHAITRRQYEALTIGAPRARVVARLGAPQSPGSLRKVEMLAQDMRGIHHCIYYNMDDGSFGDVYRLCFALRPPHRLNDRDMLFDA